MGETMRRFFGLLAAIVLGLAAIATPGRPQPAAEKTSPAGAKYRLVIQVSDADPKRWNQVLNNIDNLYEDLGRSNIDVEIVAYGMGVGLLKLDSPQADRIQSAATRGAKMVACENTMKRQELTRDDMLPDIGYAKAGIVEIMDKRRQGWQYIKG